MIYIATDHRGFELKEKLKTFLADLGYEVRDCGALAYDVEDDYPDFISKAAEAVSKDPKNAKGIILGGSGQGEAIMANRYPHVRAALYYGGPEDIVTLSRVHNDSNVLSLGAVFVDEELAKKVILLWLATPFSNEERHMRRIKKIEEKK